MTELLEALAAAVAGRTDEKVMSLALALRDHARRTMNFGYLDLATCVAAEYARGGFDRAEALMSDGLWLAGEAA